MDQQFEYKCSSRHKYSWVTTQPPRQGMGSCESLSYQTEYHLLHFAHLGFTSNLQQDVYMSSFKLCFLLYMKDLWELFENADKIGEPSALLRSQGNECWQKSNQAVFLESTLTKCVNILKSVHIHLLSLFYIWTMFLEGKNYIQKF